MLRILYYHTKRVQQWKHDLLQYISINGPRGPMYPSTLPEIPSQRDIESISKILQHCCIYKCVMYYHYSISYAFLTSACMSEQNCIR